MVSDNRVEQIESDLKLLKNEIKQVLLEIQEHVLNAQNPFTITASGFAAGQKRDAPEHIVSTQPALSTLAVDAIEGTGSVEGKPSTDGEASRPGPGQKKAASPQAEQYRAASGPGLDAPGQQGRGPDFYATGPQAVGHVGEAYVGAQPGQYHAGQSSQGDIGGYAGAEGASTPPGPQPFVVGAGTGPDVYFRQHSAAGRQGQPEAEANTSSADKPARSAAKRREGLDLVTLAALAQWTEKVLKKMGPENLETLIGLSQKTGRLPAEQKEVLLTFIHLFERKEGGQAITARQMVSVLAQLEGLLGNASADARLMSFLLQDSLEELPLIQP